MSIRIKDDTGMQDSIRAKGKSMLNFSVGPVMTWNEILSIGGQQIPYFRTAEFSGIMKDNERLMLDFSYAPDESRTVFLTGSGTMAMEVAVASTLSNQDKALIINGGSFGQRFVNLCKLHGIPHDELKLDLGEALTTDLLDNYNPANYSTLIVNMHETSTGVLYDMDAIKKFCESGNLFLIVDAISAFLADKLDMRTMGIDVMITSSQKALACAPGISMLTLTPRAIERVKANEYKNMYMDMRGALSNADRGQTPFTPAVSILLQINKRLHMIEDNGGPKEEITRVHDVATYFRSKIKNLPLEFVSKSQSNAVTCLHPTNMLARMLVDRLKNDYGIWVCPNGGEHADYMFRVGHIGNITNNDIDVLVDSLRRVILQ